MYVLEGGCSQDTGNDKVWEQGDKGDIRRVEEKDWINAWNHTGSVQKEYIQEKYWKLNYENLEMYAGVWKGEE